MVVRGRVQNGVIVLDPESRLAEGQEVSVVSPPLSSTLERGSPAAIVAALKDAPKVPSPWVDELEKLIAEGKRPLAPPVEFAEDLLTPENS